MEQLTFNNRSGSALKALAHVASWLLCLGCLTAPAHAAASSPFSLELNGGAGWTSGNNVEGVVLEGGELAGYRVARLGLVQQLAIGVGPSMSGVGATVGLGFEWKRVELNALGEVGAHVYEGIGSKFLFDDPGAKGTLIYEGMRASFGYVLRRRRSDRFVLSAFGFWNRDLKSVERSYSYEETGWFSDEVTIQEASHRVGQSPWGAGLSLGVKYGG